MKCAGWHSKKGTFQGGRTCALDLPRLEKETREVLQVTEGIQEAPPTSKVTHLPRGGAPQKSWADIGGGTEMLSGLR